MQATASEATRNGILTTLGATIGLALGPSVIACSAVIDVSRAAFWPAESTAPGAAGVVTVR